MLNLPYRFIYKIYLFESLQQNEYNKLQIDNGYNIESYQRQSIPLRLLCHIMICMYIYMGMNLTNQILLSIQNHVHIEKVRQEISIERVFVLMMKK